MPHLRTSSTQGILEIDSSSALAVQLCTMQLQRQDACSVMRLLLYDAMHCTGYLLHLQSRCTLAECHGLHQCRVVTQGFSLGLRWQFYHAMPKKVTFLTACIVCTGLRAMEGIKERGALLGEPVGRRQAGLAHRVLGNGGFGLWEAA